MHVRHVISRNQGRQTELELWAVLEWIVEIGLFAAAERFDGPTLVRCHGFVLAEPQGASPRAIGKTGNSVAALD